MNFYYYIFCCLFSHKSTHTLFFANPIRPIDLIIMDILKETGTRIVHNPESNMGDAVGYPPVLELMRRGPAQLDK